MARPTKSTVDYFPHYIKAGRTLFILENDYGNDGYAFWFKLLEVLGDTEGMAFHYGDQANKRFLLSKTRVDEEKGVSILETLAQLGTIDKDLWQDHQIIWVQNLVDNVKDAFKKRIGSLPHKPGNIVSSTGNHHIRDVSDTGNDDNDAFPPEEIGKEKEKEKEKEKVKRNEIKEDPSSRNKKTAYSEDNVYYQMSLYFHSKIMEHAAINKVDHLIRNVNMQTWADDFCKIVEIDKRDTKELHKIIDWSTSDSFWQKNILSPDKLRKKYIDLAIKMNSNPSNHGYPKKKSKFEDTMDFLDKQFRKVEQHEGDGSNQDYGHDHDSLPEP
ncbi:Lin1244/Lin1753 domain-containing protein [Cohnella herbarum]|uniref:DUF4373 domain-containing protein n=1 Tax=Cohnella herbarum TaxID=2728023 RepID=A0A7Z2ZPL4_9BACL|nr:Lin1244/Lin1753 domain-containing protein [Cohnella herbarum]QJD87591.1 DUF4373 domain-containing protein [Cohnella herbarum]